jgi:hypothetical protein
VTHRFLRRGIFRTLERQHIACESSGNDLGRGGEPQFSPDGRWLTFTAMGGGGIAIRPFPGPGPHIQISRGRQRRLSGAAYGFHVSTQAAVIRLRCPAVSSVQGKLVARSFFRCFFPR